MSARNPAHFCRRCAEQLGTSEVGARRLRGMCEECHDLEPVRRRQQMKRTLAGLLCFAPVIGIIFLEIDIVRRFLVGALNGYAVALLGRSRPLPTLPAMVRPLVLPPGWRLRELEGPQKVRTDDGQTLRYSFTLETPHGLVGAEASQAFDCWLAAASGRYGASSTPIPFAIANWAWVLWREHNSPPLQLQLPPGYSLSSEPLRPGGPFTWRTPHGAQTSDTLAVGVSRCWHHFIRDAMRAELWRWLRIVLASLLIIILIATR